MAYEYPYQGGYNPYMPGVGATGYPMPTPSQRPYTGTYGPGNNMPTANTPQPQLPVQPVQQSNMPWIQVPNIEAARNVMVQPNQTAYMMNQNAPEFYVKATDAMGVATLRSFKFQEFDPTEEAAKEVLSSQAGNLVSREEFNNFAQAVSAQFNALQQGMNTLAPAPVSAPVSTPVAQAPTTVPLVPPETKKKESTK